MKNKIMTLLAALTLFCGMVQAGFKGQSCQTIYNLLLKAEQQGETKEDLKTINDTLKIWFTIDEKSSETGFTLLGFAASSGLYGATLLLLNHGANPNVKANSGKTPLYRAADKGYQNIVQALLEFGGDCTIKDNDGNTPYDVGSDEIKQIFKQWHKEGKLSGLLKKVDTNFSKFREYGLVSRSNHFYTMNHGEWSSGAKIKELEDIIKELGLEEKKLKNNESFSYDDSKLKFDFKELYRYNKDTITKTKEKEIDVLINAKGSGYNKNNNILRLQEDNATECIGMRKQPYIMFVRYKDSFGNKCYEKINYSENLAEEVTQDIYFEHWHGYCNGAKDYSNPYFSFYIKSSEIAYIQGNTAITYNNKNGLLCKLDLKRYGDQNTKEQGTMGYDTLKNEYKKLEKLYFSKN